MQDRKLAAIVFTDIVGYTKRMEADEDHTMKLLARQREIVFPIVKEYGGEVIKEIGDGLLIMFNSAIRAVRFAMAVQEKLKDDELTIRAGIHIGDVIFEGGDVFGSAVNIAARIEPLAPEGGICISEDVRNQIRNRQDIITASVGKKELKGVKESIEIYCVISKEEKESLVRRPFLKELWYRRVFQVTGIYILLAYLVRLGIGFVVAKYMLSPHLVNLIWYIMLSLIPSIILLSYFHGRKGISRWHKAELIGMPVNIVAALLILIFVFQGKDLGAMTTLMTVEDEEGNTIEKVVMKNEFRKKILIFNFENISGDTSLDYLQYGIPIMVNYDLSQDLLVSSYSTKEIFTRIIESGDEDGIGLPVPLMKRFAEQLSMNHFLDGSIYKEDGHYTVNVKLYDTKSTRIVSEINLKDTSLFELADDLSIKIKEALGFPETHISNTEDLKVSELFTTSERALKYFSMAWVEENLNNWDKSLKFYERAVEEDSDFILAYFYISQNKFFRNDIEGALKAMEIARSKDYKLTDRTNLSSKIVYYKIKQEADKILSVAKMWVELFPDDLTAHTLLALQYYYRNLKQESIDEYKEILRLDPEQYNTLSILGSLYMSTGQYDSAFAYYQEYSRLQPEQASSYKNLGKYYLAVGDMSQAKENYEKALYLADPSESNNIKMLLADISMKTGKYVQACDQFMEVLEDSRTAQDSADVYRALTEFYYWKGQLKQSIKASERGIALEKKFYSPVHWMVRKIYNTETYLRVGEPEKALKMLEEIKKELEPPIGNIVYYGYMQLYAELGDEDKFQEAVSKAHAFIDDYGEDILISSIYYAQGKMNEKLGNFQAAIDNYNRYSDIDPNMHEVYCKISRCYRHIKEYKKAKENIDISLKYLPYHPTVNFEAALLFLETGDEEKGREYLERAVEIWKDADKDYDKSNLAKQKLDSLE